MTTDASAGLTDDDLFLSVKEHAVLVADLGGKLSAADARSLALLALLEAERAKVRALHPHAKWLRMAAAEISKAGHAGWGNTCAFAADAIDAVLPASVDAKGEDHE
jgi:hypothetical protein